MEEAAARPAKENAMQIVEDEAAERGAAAPGMEGTQRHKQLALLASGWSMDLVRKRAVQEAFDTFVIPAW